jgi:hypothetical protein
VKVYLDGGQDNLLMTKISISPKHKLIHLLSASTVALYAGCASNAGKPTMASESSINISQATQHSRKSTMSFINETVSEADIEKYKLRDINQRYHSSLRDMNIGKWTIDRERDIYVRKMGTGREDLSSQTTFTFFWRGHLFFWILDLLDYQWNDGNSKVSWGLVNKKELYLPNELEPYRSEIIHDFKEALKVREAEDFLIQPKSHSVDFQF